MLAEISLVCFAFGNNPRWREFNGEENNNIGVTTYPLKHLDNLNNSNA